MRIRSLAPIERRRVAAVTDDDAVVQEESAEAATALPVSFRRLRREIMGYILSRETS
jgi:hypothetical protein